MLKRIAYFGAMSMVVWAVSACDQDAGSKAPAGSATAAATAASAAVDVGSEIVAATSKTSFREGKVTKLEGTKVTFEYGTPDNKTGTKPTQTVDKDKVWLAGHDAEAKVGDYLVCKVSSTSWYPCQVKEVSGSVVKIEDHYGKTHNVDNKAILKPDPPTQANIKDYLETEAKHRGFDQAFEAAGKPVKPAGWEAKKGEKIVIHFVGTSWYGGTVVENKKDKGKVRIDWEGDTWDDRDVAPEEVAPQPSKAMEVKDGQFAIVRPKSPTMRWEHTKVVKVEGDGVEVINRDGEARKVGKSDLIPIAP